MGLLQSDSESLMSFGVLGEAVTTYIVNGDAPWFQHQCGSYLPLISALVGVSVVDHLCMRVF